MWLFIAPTVSTAISAFSFIKIPSVTFYYIEEGEFEQLAQQRAAFLVAISRDAVRFVPDEKITKPLMLVMCTPFLQKGT